MRALRGLILEKRALAELIMFDSFLCGLVAPAGASEHPLVRPSEEHESSGESRRRGRSSSYEEHVPIFEAIRTSDPAAAATAMRAHMESARARLTETLADHRASSVMLGAGVPRNGTTQRP